MFLLLQGFLCVLGWLLASVELVFICGTLMLAVAWRFTGI
jgi:hypothetical protein